jgi:hypothetical protein
MVIEEFKRLMTAKGNDVNIYRIKGASSKDLPTADLYVFGSPTHFGKAVGRMVRLVKKLSLPSGTNYAVMATCSAAGPNKNGSMPSGEELEKMRRTIPMLDEQFRSKGMKKVAEMNVFVQPET